MSAPSRSGAPAPDFSALGLPERLARHVARLGFAEPTPIQVAAIPPLLAGRDLVGIAQTGTGKTAAFALPLLARLDPAALRVQALVLTPTRELALQVADAVGSLASADSAGRRPEVAAIYGGSPFGPQMRALARGAQVVVGTPGRVLDLLARGALDLDGVRYLVLDEADEMLRMGFAEDVEAILLRTPPGRQVALFSATMPAAIRSVARSHLVDPVEVATSRASSTVSGVVQEYAVVPFRHKVTALIRILAVADGGATLVFVRTRSAAEEVGSALVARGVPAATISGDVAQRDREKIVERLRAGTLDVLVATDVAARGLDVERIGLVVNFDAPAEVEAYVHRIGRTGRAGRSGRALTLFTPHERARLRAVEHQTRVHLTKVAVPTAAEVAVHRARTTLEAAARRLETGADLEPFRVALDALRSRTGMTVEELAIGLLALAVGDGPAAEAPGDRDESGVDLAGFDFDPERPVGARGERRPRTDRKPRREAPGTGERAPRRDRDTPEPRGAAGLKWADRGGARERPGEPLRGPRRRHP